MGLSRSNKSATDQHILWIFKRLLLLQLLNDVKMQCKDICIRCSDGSEHDTFSYEDPDNKPELNCNHPWSLTTPFSSTPSLQIPPPDGEKQACPPLILLRKGKLWPGKAFCLQVAWGRTRKTEQERGLRGKNKCRARRRKSGRDEWGKQRAKWETEGEERESRRSRENTLAA